MKYNILYVIDNMEFGGGEKGFAQIVYGINRSQYKVHVACNPGGEFEARLRAMDIQLERVNMKSKFNLFTILKLIRILKEGRFHIIHTQGARADFFGRVSGRLARVPHIICTVAMPVEGFDVGLLQKKIYRFMDQLTERYVERFIVVSDSLKQMLVEGRGIPAHKVVRIYNGIELSQYHPDVQYGNLRQEWGIPQDVPFIGAIGRMVWQKGFEYLIQAIPDIVRDVPDAKFLFVGDGPLKERLEASGKGLKVKRNIIFTGFRSDIREILSAVNLLVIPSLLEGFPMITLEAMAMAKPIIATNIDGITEQITNGVDGILVPPKDPSVLAKAVIGVLNDRETARTMGLAARKRVEQEFSVEKMISETEKVYLSLLRAG